MLSPEQIKAAQERAFLEFQEEEVKKFIAEAKAKLAAQKAHFFNKRIVFQWPVRLEDWVKPSCKCGGGCGCKKN